MAEEKTDANQKVVEKYYIEISASPYKKFLNGLLGGIGWGVGASIGAGILIYIITIIIAKIDFVPILGQFLADVIKSSQGNLNTR